MVVDTSAILAVALEEAEASSFAALIFAATAPAISAATVVEIAAVATRRFDGQLDERLDLVIRSLPLVVSPVTPAQALVAANAYRRYGIGTRHPARLNFGDCFAYALAVDTGRPLLFKGEDFARTDVTAAI